MDGNILIAILVVLVATVLLVPLAKWAGLGTVLGYIAAGVLIGPYGLSLVSDSEQIRHVAEFGIVMMLFLIGLEVDARELWRMRHHVLGMGITQMAVTSALLAGLFYLTGFTWPAAVIVGLALAMSSTAIALQSVAQRGLNRTDTGRSTLSILLVQDVAVIPILAVVPLLATVAIGGAGAVGEEMREVAEHPFDWWVALGLVVAFLGALVGSRYVVRPLMRWIAIAKVPEAFTAFALALVIGAALMTQTFGLSPALGAFLGGVLLADSEYRHELESNIEPFKGLLLGLFFISVGMSIAFHIVVEQPLAVLALVGVLTGVKMAVLFGLATLFRMHIAERLMLAVLLSQAGEFAFVVLEFARTAGTLPVRDAQLLTVVVALSMATTPLLLFVFDKAFAPRLRSRKKPDHAGGDAAQAMDSRDKVIVLGYGRFGQIVTRLLRSQGYEMTLIDDDAAQIELVRRFGVKVFYGDASRPEILRAAGAHEAKMIVVAVADAERIIAIVDQVRRTYPGVIIAARAIDRSHAHDLMARGVEVFERETFQSAMRLGQKALVALGQSEDEAKAVAVAFERHDLRMLEESYPVRHDQAAYIGLVRRSTALLDEVMRADRVRGANPENDATSDIDNERREASE